MSTLTGLPAWRRAMPLAAALLFAYAGLAEDVVTARLDFGIPVNGLCANILSGADGLPVRTFSPDPVLHHGKFVDPVPLGSVVTKIEVTLWAGGWAGPPEAIGVAFWRQNSLDPATQIGEPVPFASPLLTCHEPPPQVVPTFHFVSETYPAGFPNYAYRDKHPGVANFITVQRIGGSFYGLAVEGAEIKIHYEPPPRIEFVTTFADAKHRRILLHNYRNDPVYPFSSPYQESDSSIVVHARVLKANGDPLPNQRIYFRLLDPPDTAPYMLNRGTWDDNHTPLLQQKGKLSVYETTSDAAGVVSTTLTVPDHIAGNNYVVEAGFTDELLENQVPCELLDCFRSFEFTTWKRIYLEHDAMFRQGSLLWADSGATAPPQIPNDPDRTRSLYVTDRGQFGRNDSVMVVHAPRLDGIGSPESYSETRTVQRVERMPMAPKGGGRIILDRPLQGDYYAQDSGDSRLGDGVGVVGPVDSPSDWTLMANTLFLSPFTQAFVEYVHLPLNWTERPPGSQAGSADPVALVPYVHVLDAGIDGLTRSRQYALKWFSNAATPNHQHLIGADSPANGLDRGATQAGNGLNGTNVTYIYTGLIDGRHHSYADFALNGEVTFHELSHQWHVDEFELGPPDSEHCLEFMWPTTDLSCSMVPNLGREVIAPGVDAACTSTVCDEWFDGRVGFHVIFDGFGNVRSEFSDIRRRPEPVPQLYGVPNQ